MKLLKALVIVTLVLVIYQGRAQQGFYKLSPVQMAALKSQANITANAIITQNYKVLANHTYPAIIEAMGGEAKMTVVLKKGMEQMKAQGFSFKSLTIGNITHAKKSGTELFAIVPDTLRMNAAGGFIVAPSALIAISEDEGKRWYFVDTAPMQNDNIKKIIPNFPKGLVIPGKSQPAFVEKH